MSSVRLLRYTTKLVSLNSRCCVTLEQVPSKAVDIFQCMLSRTSTIDKLASGYEELATCMLSTICCEQGSPFANQGSFLLLRCAIPCHVLQQAHHVNLRWSITALYCIGIPEPSDCLLAKSCNNVDTVILYFELLLPKGLGSFSRY